MTTKTKKKTAARLPFDMQIRVERLDLLVREKRILRGAWYKSDQARYRACLLTALVPEAGDTKNPNDCPASVMPLWLAHLTVWIDDDGSPGKIWEGFVQRYARVARRWFLLDDAAWVRLRYEIGVRVIDALLAGPKPLTADLRSWARGIRNLYALGAGGLPDPPIYDSQLFAARPAAAYHLLREFVFDGGGWREDDYGPCRSLEYAAKALVPRGTKASARKRALQKAHDVLIDAVLGAIEDACATVYRRARKRKAA